MFAVASARADGLPSSVMAALTTAGIPVASTAVIVQPVDGKAPLLAHNAQRPMNPASVMKLVTTYAALGVLGPAYTWKTEALVDKAPVNGRLAGNLYLKGGGDPKFAIEHFWALLRQLRVRGVSDIDGDVVLDRSAFEVPPAQGNFDDKPFRPYNVGPDALLINFRSLRFTFVPRGGKVNVLLETPSEGLAIDNRLRLTDDACGEDWKNRIAVRPVAEEGSTSKPVRLEFTGSYSRSCREKSYHLAPLTADAQVGGLFRALWRELGGSVNGAVRAGTVPDGALPLAEQESPPLAEVVRDINKYSNNVMARQLYLAMGSDGARGSVENARRRVLEWLGERGLVFDELDLENGSGLSRRERISAQSLDRLLMDAWNSPVMPEFVSSLPIIGLDGTMKKRLRDSGVSGRAHMKSGTLDGVKAAAGYALDSFGRRYAVVFLINDPQAGRGQAAIDALLLWVARQGL